MIPPARAAAALVGAAALLVGLAGCAPEPGTAADPAPTEAPTTTPPATTDPDPEPDAEAPAATELPDSCTRLISDERIAAIDPALRYTANDAVDRRLRDMLGPATYAAVHGSETALRCTWKKAHSDAVAVVAVAVLDDATREDLLASLRNSWYSEVEAPAGADAAFTQDGAYDRLSTDNILFADDYLVVATHSVRGDFAGLALETMLEMNG